MEEVGGQSQTLIGRDVAKHRGTIGDWVRGKVSRLEDTRCAPSISLSRTLECGAVEQVIAVRAGFIGTAVGWRSGHWQSCFGRFMALRYPWLEDRRNILATGLIMDKRCANATAAGYLHFKLYIRQHI
jgi:hypothetical protein